MHVKEFVKHVTGKDKHGKEVKKMGLEARTRLVVEYHSVAVQKLREYGYHSFQNHMQSVLYLETLLFLCGVVHITSDFAMNPVCRLLLEVQSQHWSPTQVTLYNATVFYWLDGKFVKVYYHVVSDDLTHDDAAATAFQKLIIDDLKDKGVKVEKLVWWSDGAPQHFKNAAALWDNTWLATHYGVSIHRFFFSPGHGKGEHDGTAAYIKFCCSAYNFSEEGAKNPIRNARMFYDYCHQHLTGPSRKHKQKKTKMCERRFLYLETVDRTEKSSADGADVGTRSKFEMRFDPAPSGQALGRLYARELGCACSCCAAATVDEREAGTCPLAAWVGSLQPKVVKPRGDLAEAEAEAMESETLWAADDAIDKGSTLAHLLDPDDRERCLAVVKWEGGRDEDTFALLRITKSVHELEEDTVDGLDGCLEKGSVVVAGRMYSRAADDSGTFMDVSGVYYKGVLGEEVLVYCNLVVAAAEDLEQWVAPPAPTPLRRDAPMPTGTDFAEYAPRDKKRQRRAPQRPGDAATKYEPREGTRVLPIARYEEYMELTAE